jgi:hypothetical protein
MAQHSFSRLWNGFATDADAKAMRDKKYRELKSQGYRVTRFTLTNQVRQYAGLGQPDGRSCTVYMLDCRPG